MSCYNASQFLVEAIESVLQQTLTDFEFILIDDGSSDNTLDIIKRYVLKDRRLVLIEKENTGLTDSLNIGICASRGEWIARLDADDVALSNRLEEQYSYMRGLQDTFLVGSGFIEIDQHGKIIKSHKYPQRHHALLGNLKKSKRFFPHSSAMFRSDIVSKFGGYNPRIVCAEDWDLWLRFAEHGKIACLDKPLVKIRKHSNNISNSEGGKTQASHGLAATICHFLRSKGVADPSTCENEADWRAFIEWVALRSEQEGVFEKLKEWAQIRHAYFSAGNKMIGAWQLTMRFATSRNALQMLHEHLFGSDLPATLADEWIMKSQSAENSPMEGDLGS